MYYSDIYAPYRWSPDGKYISFAHGSEVRVLDVTSFEVDLAYHPEILKSALDLRQSDIASRQQVLVSERDVQLSLKQLELARRRGARCQQ